MTLPRWTPFVRGTRPRQTLVERIEFIEKVARDFGVSVEQARTMMDDIDANEDVWVNSRYQVNVRRTPPPNETTGPGWPDMIHLSIKRHDRAPIGPERYRDFMLIRDELVGPKHEAVELYPRRSREVDSSNQYHLWVLADDSINFPFGFRDGRHVRDLPNGVGSAGARQNPFEEHHPR
ncbi:MAG TPA: hypothetical protein VGJ60_07400 [Chloroflexota bacterium]